MYIIVSYKTKIRHNEVVQVFVNSNTAMVATTGSQRRPIQFVESLSASVPEKYLGKSNIVLAALV